MKVTKINALSSAKNEAVMNSLTIGSITLIGYGFGIARALKGAQFPLCWEALYAVGFILLGAIAIIAVSLALGFVKGLVRAWLYNRFPKQLMPRLEVEIADDEFEFHSPKDLEFITLEDGSHVALSGLKDALQN